MKKANCPYNISSILQLQGTEALEIIWNTIAKILMDALPFIMKMLAGHSSRIFSSSKIEVRSEIQ